MKISTQTRYAIRFLVELSNSEMRDSPTTLHYIAEKQGISENYLDSIATKLKKNGYLRSFKGSGGGYCLVRDIEDITVGEIMRLMESTYYQVHCICDAEELCINYGHCQIADTWKLLEKQIDDVVDSVRLSQLTDKNRPADIEEDIQDDIHADIRESMLAVN